MHFLISEISNIEIAVSTIFTIDFIIVFQGLLLTERVEKNTQYQNIYVKHVQYIQK